MRRSFLVLLLALALGPVGAVADEEMPDEKKPEEKKAAEEPAKQAIDPPLLADVLARHKLQLLSLQWRPPLFLSAPTSSARSRHAGTLNLALSSKRVLTVAQVQAATEDLRAAVEGFGLTNVFGLNTHFFARHTESRTVNSSVPWVPVPVPGEPSQNIQLQTVHEEDLSLRNAVSWYARCLCWRTYVVVVDKRNELLEARDWKRIDLWCAANTKEPRKGVKVVARPKIIKSEVAVGPVMRPSKSTLPLTASMRPVGLLLTHGRGSGASILRAEVVVHTEGRPLDKGQFERIALDFRKLFESWAPRALGSMAFEVYEPGRHDPSRSTPRIRVGLRRDRKYDKAARFSVSERSLRVPTEPVQWYGTWIWHRALYFMETRSGALIFRRRGRWEPLAYWAAANAAPAPSGGSVSLHTPKLIKGKLPQLRGRGR